MNQYNITIKFHKLTKTNFEYNYEELSEKEKIRFLYIKALWDDPKCNPQLSINGKTLGEKAKEFIYFKHTKELHGYEPYIDKKSSETLPPQGKIKLKLLAYLEEDLHFRIPKAREIYSEETPPSGNRDLNRIKVFELLLNNNQRNITLLTDFYETKNKKHILDLR